MNNTNMQQQLILWQKPRVKKKLAQLSVLVGILGCRVDQGLNS
jgi:hypothetical protein